MHTSYARWVDESVERVVVCAKFKLYNHEHKGLPSYKNLQELLDLLQNEVNELRQAVETNSKEAVQSECGDVANYIALILDYIALKGKNLDT